MPSATDPLFAIELIHASHMGGFVLRHRHGDKIGVPIYGREPRRVFRTYTDDGSFHKDLAYLQSRTWPTAKAKSAVYLGCRQVDPVDRFHGAVWC